MGVLWLVAGAAGADPTSTTTLPAGTAATGSGGRSAAAPMTGGSGTAGPDVASTPTSPGTTTSSGTTAASSGTTTSSGTTAASPGTTTSSGTTAASPGTPPSGAAQAHVSGVPSTTVPTYLEVASDGGVFSFGGAPFYGSMGGTPLNKPIVGMASTPDNRGYWLVAADGGIFAFGDAAFHGSTGGITLNRPIVGMAGTPSGGGYWLVASDGGIFAFGDAGFHGSAGSLPLNSPVVSMDATPDGGGYWLVAADGGVFTYGDAGYYGSMGGDPLNAPIVGSARTLGTGQVTLASATAYAPGSYGYDVSSYQCGNNLPGHTIGIVEVTGTANGAPNPCLAQEAAWAGNGLNLYVFLTYGTSGTSEPGCGGDTACNWGASAIRYAAAYAASVGVDTHVTWWLDIEGGSTYWSSNTSANDQVIAGAISAVHAMGLTAGVYTSPLSWAGITGNMRPSVPVWVAWYTGNPQANCANAMSFASSNGDLLPTGGVWLTQYTDNNGTLDGDYAC